MVECNYRVKLSDFREAYYYLGFVQRRTLFRIIFIVLIAFAIYIILWKNEIVALIPAAVYTACAFLVYLLLQLAAMERQILKYAKSADSLVNVEYQAKFGGKQFTIQVPERNFSMSGSIEELACVFEITHSFLLYLTDRQLFIVPTTGMSEKDRALLRKTFSSNLGDRFAARSLKK